MQIKFPLLNAEDIEIRVNRIIKCYAENAQGERVEYYKADLLLYKDARVDMYYLDRYVGADSWQRTHRAEEAPPIIKPKNTPPPKDDDTRNMCIMCGVGISKAVAAISNRKVQQSVCLQCREKILKKSRCKK